ncbi:MAG TPA: small ribosomal subunit Rsm22 family protein [Xanthobacteraceae bacterium]|nr:small ribosomal subunit Rsm22 family protein [Xanthobacteraceae bacterium]
MDADLPADLRGGLEQLTQGRSHGALAQRAAALSQRYRAGGRSADAIRDHDDALAYALTRLPATYAAAAAALSAVAQARPAFAPRTLLDVGAGPGTAAWAAAKGFPTIADVRLVDDNPALRALARALLAASDHAALRHAAYAAGALAELGGAPADLVVASYLIGELAPAALARAAEVLWSLAGAMLVVVEPGTPAGFARIRDLRAQLIARGARVAAPCPHDAACPIVAPDWCHFARRLARSRSHQRAKGAALAYEDEKFAYVALAREPLAREPLAREPGARFDARVLAHPRVTKAGIAAKLCTAEGIITEVTPRRDRARYKPRIRWRWGDAVDRTAEGT